MMEGDVIDLLLEDDALLPPSLQEDRFKGFRLSVSEGKFRRTNTRRFSSVIDNILGPKGRNDSTQPGNNNPETDRKSLSWHSSFLTHDGILDTEELELYNPGYKNAHLQNSDLSNVGKSAQKPPKISSRSNSMARVPATRSELIPRGSAKRSATTESTTLHKKPRPWLLSGGFISSAVSILSSSGGSVKNMFKSPFSFLKKKLDTSSMKTSSSTRSKVSDKRPSQLGRRSMPKLSSLSSLQSDNRTAAFSPLSPTSKNTLFSTPDSQSSRLRMPSARFGFFDHDQRPSIRWEQIFYASPASPPQVAPPNHTRQFQSPATICSETQTAYKLRSSVTSSIPVTRTPTSNTIDKENKCKIEAQIEGLSKLLSSIDLERDLAIELKGKKGTTQLCLTDINSETPPRKSGSSVIPSVSNRTPLAAYNRIHYTSASNRY